jgi:hypothetical protein
LRRRLDLSAFQTPKRAQVMTVDTFIYIEILLNCGLSAVAPDGAMAQFSKYILGMAPVIKKNLMTAADGWGK